MKAKVLLPRPAEVAEPDAQAFRDAGFEVVAEPFLQTTIHRDATTRDAVTSLLQHAIGGWLLLTSAEGGRSIATVLEPRVVEREFATLRESGTQFAAVGPTSAAMLRSLGANSVLTPEDAHTAVALLAAMRDLPAAKVSIPCSDIAGQTMSKTLHARGWAVMSRAVYSTTPVEMRPASADQLQAGEIDLVILRSPSAANALLKFVDQIPHSVRFIATGPTTAEAARRLGLNVVGTAVDSRVESLIELAHAATEEAN